ncbi:GHKL domain-containing protein [Paenibacillus sp. MMS20-IR301]|uniref:GHKL domain-containing protein n=1 Tax=Paenibacillus sp. MMS20-IR301 TaxID=2895946 RepID=UPI0028EA87D9|nr:GHKL domain-containing protein [Paenibacillus sp. MMS20-IR301]WNS43413.1 GHKL domain-containing protein [Paenibacillus sp. MMS20-IR301]
MLTYFVGLSLFLLCSLTGMKVLITHYSVGKAAQIALAEQYIGIAENIAGQLDKEAYEQFLLTKQDNAHRQEIKTYLEQYRAPMDALFVYILLLDETDISKVMVSALPPHVNDVPIGSPCTVPPAKVIQAKNGLSYYTDIVKGEHDGSYLSVGVPFYSKDGTMLGVLGIDIDAKDLADVSRQVVSSDAFIYGIDVIFAVALLAVVFILNRLYKSRLKRNLKETEEVYLSELEKVMDTIKSSRHDIMNHLHVISGLIDMEMYSDVAEYLKQLKIESQPLDLSLRVKSPILLVLFHSKWELAYSLNIQMSFETDWQEYDRIESFDLVKIYANLLDNALEATAVYSGQQPKNIHVICKSLGKKYVFAVENTALLSPEAQKRLFQRGYTTKKSGKSVRGNGLTIVKNTVEKYQGDIYYHYEQEKVFIQIML